MRKSRKILRRRRRPAEISTLRAAVRNFCIECVGYQAGEVPRCTARQCHLWPWRMGFFYYPEDLVADELPYAGQEDFPDALVEHPLRPIRRKNGMARPTVVGQAGPGQRQGAGNGGKGVGGRKCRVWRQETTTGASRSAPTEG